jgi:hypothetical protein
MLAFSQVLRLRVLLVAGLIAVTSTVAIAATVTTLTVTSGGSSVSTVTSGSVVTLTATVTAGTTPVTVGQVNFCDATAKSCTDIHLLGAAQLTKAGTAILKFTPPVGSHNYNAIFMGTPKGVLVAAASTSNTVALTVTGANPTVTAIAQSGPVGNYTLTATVGGMGSTAPTGTVSFINASNGNAVLGTAALTPGNAGLSFLNWSGFSFGDPGTFAVGDFNEDGIPDIAWISPKEGSCAQTSCNPDFTVSLGDGHGNFTTAWTFNIGNKAAFYYSSFTYVSVGDFNGDGILDLALAFNGYPSDNVQIMLGKGDGTFSISGSVPLPLGSNSFIVEDFNGDGIPDIAFFEQTTSGILVPHYISIYLGNGDGTFQVNPVTTTLMTNVIASIAVGDFNGDGILDLAVESSNPAWRAGMMHPPAPYILSILLGNGDGTFSTALSPMGGTGNTSIGVGDFNGDGILDLADGGTILLGNGDGTFTPSSGSPVSLMGNYVGVGDFNGDGILDLAVTGAIFLGKGDGTFSAMSPGVPSAFSAVGDLFGDGRSDLFGIGTLQIPATMTSTATINGITVPVATASQEVLARYSGDSNYDASASSEISLAAAQDTPMVSLTASPNPTTLGASVTLTATVTGSGLTPTGSITFYVVSNYNGANWWNPLNSSGVSLNSSGVATYTTSSLAKGQDNIIAQYNGDTYYIQATSPAVIVSVYLATPTITWPTPDAITYGTALSATQLDATESIAGTFVYNPALGTVLNAGQQTLSVTFTPTDTADYPTPAAATTTITVNQATPSVTTWPTASSITYGQTLASSTLSGGASTPAGSFAFTTPTTKPNAGTASQSVTFTPTDTTDYSTLTGTASVTVSKATPSVTTWPTASSITYGQTLASSTLTGSVSNPAGSFAFTTPTIAPNVGTASQSVTFTPTDTTDYSTLTGTASVTVGKASSSTALVSSVNPSALGLSVNFTTTVTGQNGGTPSGSVTFSYGSTSLGNVSLSSGSASLATAALPAGTDSVTAVYSGDTNFTGNTSNTVSQVINNPLPFIGSISPAFANAGGAAFTQTVNGSGFTTSSTVYWGTAALATTYVSATQLTAQVPAAGIATGNMAFAISVQNPIPGGGTSDILQFEVDSASGSTTGPQFFSVTQTVTGGSPASYQVTLPSTVESASVTCLNLPTGAACSYSATTNTVTITTSSTTPKGTYQITVVFTETVSGAATSWILLPILLLPLVFLRRKLAARGVWMTASLGLVLLAAAAYTVGCGGGGSSTTPPPQTHSVTSSGSVSITIQ